MIARKILLLLSSTLLITTAAPTYAGDFFFGAKVGQMVVDSIDIDEPVNIGINLGYEIGTVVADVGVEGEYTRTVSSGSFAGNDVDVQTFGLYLAGRTAGPLFVKGKLGFVNADVDGQPDVGGTGTSFGLGLGFSVGIAQFEFEYTKINSNINFFSAGVIF